MTRSHPTLLLLLAAAACTAAPGDEDTDQPAKFEAANLRDESDPLAVGQDMFLHDTWGTEVLGQWPPADFLLGLLADDPETFGDQFANFGFVKDPSDDLPVGLKRGVDDPTQTHETCAMCHVATLPDGRVWLGAPNTKLDIGGLRVAVDDAWVAAGNPPLMTELERAKALKLGPGRQNAETSTYEQVVAVDFPPYFQLGQRTSLNYMGTGQNVRTEVFFAIHAFGAGGNSPVPFPEERVDDFVAFLGAIEAPPAPEQDASQIAAGKAVFEAERCGSCHHVDDVSLDRVTPIDRGDGALDRIPGDDPAWPKGSIATSDLHRVLQDGEEGDDGGDGGGGADDFSELIAFIGSHGLMVLPTDGYRPSSLRGLWFTAPYLLNGAVPTLEELLSPPAERSTTFQRNGFTIDTSLRENENIGHAFGTELAAADKAALVVYLNSL